MSFCIVPHLANRKNSVRNGVTSSGREFHGQLHWLIRKSNKSAALGAGSSPRRPGPYGAPCALRAVHKGWGAVGPAAESLCRRPTTSTAGYKMPSDIFKSLADQP